MPFLSLRNCVVHVHLHCKNCPGSFRDVGEPAYEKVPLEQEEGLPEEVEEESPLEEDIAVEPGACQGEHCRASRNCSSSWSPGVCSHAPWSRNDLSSSIRRDRCCSRSPGVRSGGGTSPAASRAHAEGEVDEGLVEEAAVPAECAEAEEPEESEEAAEQEELEEAEELDEVEEAVEEMVRWAGGQAEELERDVAVSGSPGVTSRGVRLPEHSSRKRSRSWSSASSSTMPVLTSPE